MASATGKDLLPITQSPSHPSITHPPRGQSGGPNPRWLAMSPPRVFLNTGVGGKSLLPTCQRPSHLCITHPLGEQSGSPHPRWPGTSPPCFHHPLIHDWQRPTSHPSTSLRPLHHSPSWGTIRKSPSALARQESTMFSLAAYTWIAKPSLAAALAEAGEEADAHSSVGKSTH